MPPKFDPNEVIEVRQRLQWLTWNAIFKPLSSHIFQLYALSRRYLCVLLVVK